MTTDESSRQIIADLNTPINDVFLKAFADNNLIIDCPQIELRQLKLDNPICFLGCGMISLLSGQEFQLRMYANENGLNAGMPLDGILNIAHWTPGEEIPGEEYFELFATDLSGFKWSCGKVQIKHHSTGHGIVITGRLFDILKHTSQGLTPRPQLTMYFFETLKVPFKQSVFHQSKVGERVISSSFRPYQTKFNSGDFDFTIATATPEKGSTSLRVTSNTELPDALETRIEESLSYVTMSSVQWCIVDKIVGSSRQVSVVPRRPKLLSIFDEPLDHNNLNNSTDFWELFKAYFQHVVGHIDPLNYHPLSAHIYHLVAGETRQLDVVGLLVSVAAEGVLKVEYPDLAVPSDTFKKELDKIGITLDRLKCTDDNLKTRLKGMLNPMKSSRPKDKFKELVEMGEITDQMVTAWSKLRNTTAHSTITLDPIAANVAYNRCLTVYTMINRMIFHAIGYVGRYQDFSEKSWPIRDFH